MGQIRGDVLYHAIQEEAERIGINNPKSIHGLRRNAVKRLLEAGVSEDVIHCITGQSKEMIRRYGSRFNRRKVVEAAVVKMTRNADDET